MGLSLIQLVSIIVILAVLIFYFWMFWDMSGNDNLPPSPGLRFKWPPQTKSEWTTAFVFFNLFTAGYYYFTEYKKR